MHPSFVRIAPWLVLLVVAYGLGRWQGRLSREDPTASAPADAATPLGSKTETPDAATAPEAPSRAAALRLELSTLHEAARTMAMPDSRTYAFFERLTVADLPAVTEQIRAMPAGNEQDLFFAMAMRRWGELDGPGALAAAAQFPALATRRNAELGAWEAWGMHGSTDAMTRALALEPGRSRDSVFSAILTGASMTDPRQALELWLGAPEDFRQAAFGPAALNQIVAAAYGTGKREAIQTLVAGLPADETRDRLAVALCAEWGGHYPEDALRWLSATLPDGEARESAMTNIFESLLNKDPSLAATWGAEYPDPRRRAAMISSAVSSWVELNATEAELWINEQPDSRELDGATYAMAAHFIGAKDLPRAYAWISRIRQDEARAELLGNLGRAWSHQDPAAFQQFIEQKSLNRAELEQLLSKVRSGE